MAKLLARLCMALVLVPLAGWATTYEEGKQYQRLANPQPVAQADQVQVEAFFWYGCPHCRQLEPVLAAWSETLPEDVKFASVPALFGGLWNTHGQMFYALEQMGQEHQVRPAIFEAVAQRKLLKTEEEMVEFLSPMGIDGDAFKEAFNSFEVRVAMQNAHKRARAYGIQHVPLVVVNGKYLTDVSMAGGKAELTQVLEYLIDQERAQASE